MLKNFLPGFARRALAGSAWAVLKGVGGIPAQWFDRAIDFHSGVSFTQPYRNSVWVMRAIKKIAGPCSAVPVSIYRADQLAETRATLLRKGWRGAEKLSRQAALRQLRRPSTLRRVMRQAGEELAEIENPALATWLASPAVGISWADFIEACVGWLKLAGENFWLLGDDAIMPFPERRGGLKPIVVARPDRMREVVGRDGLVGWQFTKQNGGIERLIPEQVIQLRYWNPYSEYRGLSEYDAATVASEADYAAGTYNRNLMQNNGDQGVFVSYSGDIMLSDEQQKQIVDQLRQKREMQQRGIFRPMFLPADIEVQDPKVRAPDANYIASRLENRHEIAVAFGVPPSMFDVKASYSIGSASDYYQLIQDTCIPTSEKIADGLGLLLGKLLGFGVEVAFDWDDHPTMQEVRRERLTSADALWAKGMPMREVSDYLGLDLPEYPGWEDGFLPFSVTPAEQVGMDSSAFTADDYAEEPNPVAKPEDTEGPEDTEEPDDDEADDGNNGNGDGDGNRMVKRAVESMVNKRLWEQHVRNRQKSVRLYEKKVSKVLNEFRGKALQALQTHWPYAHAKGITDLIFDASEFAMKLVTSLEPVAKTVTQNAGAALMQEIGFTDPWSMTPKTVNEFIAKRNPLLRNSSQTVYDQLRTVLDAGVSEGLNVDAITENLKARFNDLQKYEARRIAMTETNAAFGFARQQAMKDAGVQRKAWLSSHGPNVRPGHRQAELTYTMSNPIHVNEPFLVMNSEGDFEELMYPGDPNGSAGNVINCQCIQLAVVDEPEEET